jgi:Tetratricopeptide repeat
MHRMFFTFVCSILVVVCVKADQDEPDSKSAGGAESANELFQAGEFARAGKLYAQTLAREPRNYRASLRLGEIALLANRLDEAEKWLKKAVVLKPDDKAAKLSLAQAYYRRDEYLKAAPLLRAGGNRIKAKMLESFKGIAPYEVIRGGRGDIGEVCGDGPAASRSGPGEQQQGSHVLPRYGGIGRRASVSGCTAWWDMSSFGIAR